MNVEIINLTPHPLNIKQVDGTSRSIPPSGTVARVAEQRQALGALAGLAVTRASYGAVEGLPAPEAGRVYVVSALVLAAAQDRPDVFSPGPAIRDGEGKIIGADGLSATAAYTPTPTNTPPVTPTTTPNDNEPGYDPRNETAPAGGSEYYTRPVPRAGDYRVRASVPGWKDGVWGTAQERAVLYERTKNYRNSDKEWCEDTTLHERREFVFLPAAGGEIAHLSSMTDGFVSVETQLRINTKRHEARRQRVADAKVAIKSLVAALEGRAEVSDDKLTINLKFKTHTVKVLKSQHVPKRVMRYGPYDTAGRLNAAAESLMAALSRFDLTGIYISVNE